MTARVTRAQQAHKADAFNNKGSTEDSQQLSSPAATSASTNKAKIITTTKRSRIKKEGPGSSTSTPVKKRNATPAKKIKSEPNELPHNLGQPLETPIKKEATPAKKRARTSAKKAKPELDDPQNQAIAEKLVAQFANSGVAQSAPAVTPKKGKKKTNYGHTPGVTPFSDYVHPTSEECHEVTRLLSSVHGKVSAPKRIPKASLTVAGCGEVPHVLDALVRTRLSANTSGNNSNRAFQGLVSKFGLATDRAGRKSLDWNAVRLADQKDVFEAIKCGGLADRKSKDIKQILDMTFEENQARRKALLSKNKDVAGGENETEEEKQEEIGRAEDDVVSLDHIHLLSNEDAFEKLISYPGIGAKTASCVMLFCMQRPSFAVDTHVWRLCKWLGWVPPNATRDQTFSHCEVRIPDELKYPLHYLLIKHGKTCPRCRAITGENSAGWDEGCVIDELVTRTGVKKGGTPKKSNAKGSSTTKGRKRKAESESESEGELSDVASDNDVDAEMSDLVSDAE
ncbi:DNA glycosylase [Tothia fuscella]|uniref:DNA glycosylase n=1 Tax=Tothia fuscella TaxID=1048955 RepID=A0A9P4U378_9PEZI|nr:DNA glycosylase [Tothia fuscella]